MLRAMPASKSFDCVAATGVAFRPVVAPPRAEPECYARWSVLHGETSSLPITSGERGFRRARFQSRWAPGFAFRVCKYSARPHRLSTTNPACGHPALTGAPITMVMTQHGYRDFTDNRAGTDFPSPPACARNSASGRAPSLNGKSATAKWLCAVRDGTRGRISMQRRFPTARPRGEACRN